MIDVLVFFCLQLQSQYSSLTSAFAAPVTIGLWDIIARSFYMLAIFEDCWLTFSFSDEICIVHFLSNSSTSSIAGGLFNHAGFEIINRSSEKLKLFTEQVEYGP